MPEVDQYLSSRPDYIVYRLFRERQPQSILKLPPGVNSGKDLLFQSLRNAANSPDPVIKWTTYGLMSLSSLRLVSCDKRLRFMRMPPRLSCHEIPIGDRLDDADFEQILKWMKQRQKKFKATLNGLPDHPLGQNHTQRYLRKEQLIDTEHWLLLALGQIAICFLEILLGHQSKELVSTTLADVGYYLSGANGVWRPGYAVYVDQLRHYRDKYGDNQFSSCYLPFDHYDYGDWLADAFGRLAKTTRQVDFVTDHYRLLLALSGVQHREWLFKRRLGQQKLDEGNKLMIALDHTIPYAMASEGMVVTGALAARYLAIGNIVGWKQIGRDKQWKTRLLRARELKPIARISGCRVEGEAADLDFSKLDKTTAPVPFRDFSAGDYRGLLIPEDLILPGACDETSIKPAGKGTGDSAFIAVADALRWHHTSEPLAKERIKVLWVAISALTRGTGLKGDERERLLNVQEDVFKAFERESLVSGVAALAGQLQMDGLLDTSIFARSVSVTIFAELLLDWLERPYMADIAVRSVWQQDLRAVYANLHVAQKQKLSLNDRLLIFSAVSHVTAAAMRSLGETEADLLEQMIYEEWTDNNAPIARSRARSDLRVISHQVGDILRQAELRTGRKTVFVQVVLSPDGTAATILAVGRVRGVLVHRETGILFSSGQHQGIQYERWSDVSDEVLNHVYFNNQTHLLHEYSLSPLGQRAVRELWTQINEITRDINGGALPDYIWIAPDAGLASMPWQLIAMSETSPPDQFPIITLVHGLRWIYSTAHEYGNPGEIQQFHSRGIHAWISHVPTPRPDLDIRGDINVAFFGAGSDCPVMTDGKGLSLSVVFGHGAPTEEPLPAETEAVDHAEKWRDVRNSRICVLLSCYTGSGKPGGLGDYVSISHKLSRISKALLAPPVEVPHTAVLALAHALHDALVDTTNDVGRNWTIAEVYCDALMRDPAVALFSLWGLGYEPLIWKSSQTPSIPS